MCLTGQKSERVCDKVCGTHEINCCGSKAHISREGVKISTEPVVRFCPLHASLYGCKEINATTVKESVERKIKEYGFCCRNRRFDDDPMVAYGASEMMSVWLDKDLIDCGVVVCDGAGTVLTASGSLIQGIGARLTGVINTSPVKEVIEHIEEKDGIVLDEVRARIDQVEGVKKAVEKGFRRLAVTVASFQARAISEIRKIESVTGTEVTVFSVCNTLAKRVDVKHIAKADIACASASKILREDIGSKALLQVGMTIPVYALSQRGKQLVLAYLASFKDRLVVFRTNRLPFDAKGKGPILWNCERA